MVIQFYVMLINKNKLRHKSTDLKGFVRVKIWYIANDKVIAINGDSITFIDQTFNIRIMIAQQV